jgi:TorA maturation chaperone TorD
MMQAIDYSMLTRYLQLRQSYYQLLQLLFFKPLEKEAFWQIKNDRALDALNDIEMGGHQLYQFFTTATEEDLQKEKDEFNRLFVGPGEIVAPPWESVYTSREKLLFDEATFQVRKLYHQFGLRLVKENNEPDDHLVAELEFMLFLARQTEQIGSEFAGEFKEAQCESLQELLQVQIDFLKDHLLAWIPQFTEKVIKHSNSLLYIGAALLLKEFIESETESLREIKEALANG